MTPNPAKTRSSAANFLSLAFPSTNASLENCFGEDLDSLNKAKSSLIELGDAFDLKIVVAKTALSQRKVNAFSARAFLFMLQVVHGTYIAGMSTAKGLVVIGPGQEAKEEVRVLAHEISHQILGHPKASKNISTPTNEIQAEIFACLLLLHLGVDTTEASFPYVQGYTTAFRQQTLSAETAEVVFETICEPIQDRCQSALDILANISA